MYGGPDRRHLHRGVRRQSGVCQSDGAGRWGLATEDTVDITLARLQSVWMSVFKSRRGRSAGLSRRGHRGADPDGADPKVAGGSVRQADY